MKQDSVLVPTDGELLAAFSRYVVAWQLIYRNRPPHPTLIVPNWRSAARARQYTAFFYLDRHVLYLVTAGHALQGVETIKAENREIVKSSLLSLHDGLGRRQPVPMPTEHMVPLWLDNAALGYDIGVVPIPRHTARLVGAGGAGALRRKSLARQNERFDAYVLVGFPDVGNSINGPTHVNGKVEASFRTGLAMIALYPVDQPVDWEARPGYRYFRVIPNKGMAWGKEVEVSDVHGMSGGPVFGLNRSGDGWQYRLIGVQSLQGDESKIIGVSPASKYLRRASSFVRQAIDQAPRRQ